MLPKLKEIQIKHNDEFYLDCVFFKTIISFLVLLNLLNTSIMSPLALRFSKECKSFFSFFLLFIKPVPNIMYFSHSPFFSHQRLFVHLKTGCTEWHYVHQRRPKENFSNLGIFRGAELLTWKSFPKKLCEAGLQVVRFVCLPVFEYGSHSFPVCLWQISY